MGGTSGDSGSVRSGTVTDRDSRGPLFNRRVRNCPVFGSLLPCLVTGALCRLVATGDLCCCFSIALPPVTHPFVIRARVLVLGSFLSIAPPPPSPDGSRRCTASSRARRPRTSSDALLRHTSCLHSFIVILSSWAMWWDGILAIIFRMKEKKSMKSQLCWGRRKKETYNLY